MSELGGEIVYIFVILEYNVFNRTNLGYLPFPVDHDIPTVTVFDLQDSTRNRICGHRLDEIEASVLERNDLFSTIIRYKKSQ